MIKNGFWFLRAVFLVLSSEAVLSKKVIAPNGRIVKQGQDLILTLENGVDWDRCTWFFQESVCSFDLNNETQTAKLHKCNSATLESAIEYFGTDRNVCSIKIKAITEQYNGTWKARTDMDEVALDIDIVVAMPTISVEISVGNSTADDGNDNELSLGVKVGEAVSIVCTVFGGRPAPMVSLNIEGLNHSRIIDDSQSQVPNEKGTYDTIQTFVIKPEVGDFNKTVSCQSVQFDEMNKPLWDVMKAVDQRLNVIFPPQPMANQTVRAQVGEIGNVSFVFKSNPEPTEVKWYKLANSSYTSTNEIENGKEIQETEKYQLLEIVDEGDRKYRIGLQVLDLQVEDEDNLYWVDVVNSIGSQSYFFMFEITEAGVEPETNGTETTETEEKGSGEETETETEEGENGEEGEPEKGRRSRPSFVFAIISVVVLAALILGSIYIFKRRKESTTTVPMTTFNT